MAAAPAIVRFVGGTVDLARTSTLRMYEVTLAESEAYRIPALAFRDTPSAIDVRKVVETGIRPVINTGIAHRDPEIGQVGAGRPRRLFDRGPYYNAVAKQQLATQRRHLALPATARRA
jgi:hypothetical protein